jgi:hypothetical protein
MRPDILLVGLNQLGRLCDDQQILGVLFLCRFGEV